MSNLNIKNCIINLQLNPAGVILFCINTKLVCAIGLYNDDSLRISLFTCSAGDDLYSKFGHTGIRVQNASIGDDIVFNY